MTGTTGLKALRVDCIVGVYPHERVQTQTVLLDIELDYDFAPAAAADAVALAVDYNVVAASVTELLQSGRFALIETVAERTAAMLLARMPGATAVRLEVRKLSAVPAAECAFVRVERAR